jgi:hypothetical protein
MMQQRLHHEKTNHFLAKTWHFVQVDDRKRFLERQKQ